MKILVINAGSSSLKYQLFDMDTGAVLAKGVCERIGIEGSTITHKRGKEKWVREVALRDHNDAIKLVIAALTDPETGVIASIDEVDAIGHRIVHGGVKITKSQLVDDQLVHDLGDIVSLNPLHGPPAIAGINASRALMPGKPNVCVFDTAYFSTMPDYAYIYGVPYEYYEKYRVRKYGFHGTSHRYVTAEAAKMLGKPLDSLRLISCHIGSGSSIAATAYGKAIDTSFGFTPNDGVLMGTRCGSIDPTVVPFVMEQEKISPAEMGEILNKRSGLLGISGVSSDCLKVMNEAAAGNDRCRLAMDMFYYSIRKIIGGLLAEMNGADAIIFTAGIAENDRIVRANICKNLDFLGIRMNEEVNASAARGEQIDITAPDSKIRLLVIPTDEEKMIALDTMAIVKAL